MPKKITPTSKQKSYFLLHFVIYAIVTAICWLPFFHKSEHWMYPWPAWTTAAWGLFVLGHFCVVFARFEDKGYVTYRRQQGYDN